ncbi:MAG: polysaccharide deacetylase family protein [Deltaproteobacteria bacterium]|nr:polysaccharide deacetylase family protein [Deltaproteobacteria bacterium]
MIKAVPILTYHHVNPLPEDMVTVTPEHFEAQMAFLKQQGDRTLFIDELLDWMAEKIVLDQKAVVLTFDDGYLDNYRFAYPLLKKYGLRATIFLVTGWAGEERAEEDLARVYSHQECRELSEAGKAGRMALNWEEARRLEKEGLVRIESHTHQHDKNLYADLVALRASLCFSQEAFQERLGKKSTCLCWPGGRYNAESLEAAREFGFTSCCTTERGLNVPWEDPMRLKRITVKDAGVGWLRKTLFLFSRPRLGNLYVRIKPR